MTCNKFKFFNRYNPFSKKVKFSIDERIYIPNSDSYEHIVEADSSRNKYVINNNYSYSTVSDNHSENSDETSILIKSDKSYSAIEDNDINVYHANSGIQQSNY